MRDQRSDGQLVVAARGDDPGAFGQLFERWFDRAWNVARTILRDDDLAADVAQDTLVGAWQRLDQLEDPEAFGGWLLRSTRNRALNKLVKEGRSRATDGDVVSGLRDGGLDDPVGAEAAPLPDAATEIRARQELVWAAASALGERDVSLLDLHLRHGLAPAEIAEELGVEANAAHQQLFRLRSRLGDAVGAYMLWRNGRPLCDGLAEAVSGRTAFDRSVAQAVTRHERRCDRCGQERQAMVDPARLFAAVPLVVVPPSIQAKAAAALEAAGVPTTGSGPDPAGGQGSDVSGPDGAGADGAPGRIDGAANDGAAMSVPDPATANGPLGQPAPVASGQAPAGSPASSMPTVPSPPTPPAAPTLPPTSAVRADAVVTADPAAGAETPLATSPTGEAMMPTAPVAPPAPMPAPTLGRQRSIAPDEEPSPPADLAMPRTQALALAGAGVLLLLALVGLGAIVLGGDDDGGGSEVAATESTTVEAPAPGGVTQDSSGSGDDPSGLASFSSDSEAEPAGPGIESTTTTSTGTDRTTGDSRRTTTDTTASTSSSTSTDTTTSTTTETTTTDTTTSTTASTTTDTTASTSSSSTTETTTTTTDPGATPRIVRFVAIPDSRPGGCSFDEGTELYQAEWETVQAEETVLMVGGGALRGEPDGLARFCAEPGSTISLTAVDADGDRVTSRLVL